MHYLAYVLVEPECGDIKARVAALLAPYDENKEMSPYFTAQDEKERRRMAEHYLGDQERFDHLGALLPHMQDWCGAPGVIVAGALGRMTSRNPLSKWDYWRVGQRWDGFILGLDPLEGDWPPGDARETLERNSCAAGTVRPDALPYAIITPTGGWWERETWRPERGQFGEFVADPEWTSRVRRMLTEDYPDHIAVAVDYHR